MEKLDLIIDCPEFEKIEYEFNLFKLDSDCCTFEQFEELFDSEDEVEIDKEPQFEIEWINCEVIRPKSFRNSGKIEENLSIFPHRKLSNHSMSFAKKKCRIDICMPSSQQFLLQFSI